MERRSQVGKLWWMNRKGDEDKCIALYRHASDKTFHVCNNAHRSL